MMAAWISCEEGAVAAGAASKDGSIARIAATTSTQAPSESIVLSSPGNARLPWKGEPYTSTGATRTGIRRFWFASAWETAPQKSTLESVSALKKATIPSASAILLACQFLVCDPGGQSRSATRRTAPLRTMGAMWPRNCSSFFDPPLST